MNKKRKARQSTPAAVGETRLGDTVTVAWMLTMMTTLACQTGMVVVRAAERYLPGMEALPTLADLLLFSALVFGVISLMLALVVLHLRRTPVPPGITIFAIAVGLTPLAIVAWRAISS